MGSLIICLKLKSLNILVNLIFSCLYMFIERVFCIADSSLGRFVLIDVSTSIPLLRCITLPISQLVLLRTGPAADCLDEHSFRLILIRLIFV